MSLWNSGVYIVNVFNQLHSLSFQIFKWFHPWPMGSPSGSPCVFWTCIIFSPLWLPYFPAQCNVPGLWNIFPSPYLDTMITAGSGLPFRKDGVKWSQSQSMWCHFSWNFSVGKSIEDVIFKFKNLKVHTNISYSGITDFFHILFFIPVPPLSYTECCHQTFLI